MKKRHFLLVVGVLLVLPLTAYAAETPTLTINGYESTQKDANYINDTGVMMVSEEVLAKDMDMAVQREGKELTVSTLRDTILLKGQVGDTTAQLVGQHTTLPTAIEEKNGKAYLPLRALISPFGEVEWNGSDKPTEVYYDLSAFEEVPAVRVSTTSLPYHEITEAEVGYDHKKQFFLGDDGEGMLLFGNLDKKENITSVSDISGQNILLEPVHKDYILENILIEKNQITWLEVTPQGDQRTGRQWYLYTKPLTKDGEPLCIEKTPKKIKNEQHDPLYYLIGSVKMKGDHIAYSFYNQETDNLEIRLYTISTKKTDILDTLGLKNTEIQTEDETMNSHISMALNDTDVVWEKSVPTTSNNYCSDLYRYNIESKKKTALLPGCNLHNPLLMQNNLILEGALNNREDNLNRECWIYDMNKNQWIARINNEIIHGYWFDYRLLDDQYLMLDISRSETQAISIVDVEKGMLYQPFNFNGIRYLGENPEYNFILPSLEKNRLYAYNWIENEYKGGIHTLMLGE